MTESPLVSIVIPTYRRQDRILRAVKSCFDQTCSCEVIVVDDNGKGSKAQLETESVLKPYIDNANLIYLINEENSRASYSRNRGLEKARGNYITFLDDDDEIHPFKLEKQAQLLKELGESYSCCYCAYHKLLKGDKVYGSDETISGSVYPYVLARVIYNGSGSNLLVRTSAAREIGGYDISFKKRQDMEFMARLLKNYKLAYLDEDFLTIHYEIRENPLTYEDLKASDDYWIQYFREEIDALPETVKHAVYESLALERLRYSLPRKKVLDAWKNAREYHVSAISYVKYFLYLIDRLVRKKSYGVKLIRWDTE